jgi:hypothetical protein
MAIDEATGQKAVGPVIYSVNGTQKVAVTTS